MFWLSVARLDHVHSSNDGGIEECVSLFPPVSMREVGVCMLARIAPQWGLAYWRLILPWDIYLFQATVPHKLLTSADNSGNQPYKTSSCCVHPTVFVYLPSLPSSLSLPSLPSLLPSLLGPKPLKLLLHSQNSSVGQTSGFVKTGDRNAVGSESALT